MEEKNNVQTIRSKGASSSMSPDQSGSVSETGARESVSGKFSSRLRHYPSGEFKIQDEGNDVLGSGSYADVCKYLHDELEIVAIKRFAVTGGAKTIEKNREMVQREANVLCRFHHRNIVEILGITQWSNAVGIILEYVDGGNLQELLSETDQSDPPWSRRLQIGQDLVSALSYIHNYKDKTTFCHGDLKPENILLTQALQVKLADFGSAALLRATGAPTTTLELVPSKQHTLIYVAPEFLENPMRDRDPSMDMYSFGLVVYELICKRAPFTGCAIPALLRELILARNKPNMKLIDETKERLQTVSDHAIFDLLKYLMMRCWDDEPASRPSSREVKIEIAAHLKQQEEDSSRTGHEAELYMEDTSPNNEWDLATTIPEDSDAPQRDRSLSCDVTTAPSPSASCHSRSSTKHRSLERVSQSSLTDAPQHDSDVTNARSASTSFHSRSSSVAFHSSAPPSQSRLNNVSSTQPTPTTTNDTFMSPEDSLGKNQRQDHDAIARPSTSPLSQIRSMFRKDKRSICHHSVSSSLPSNVQAAPNLLKEYKILVKAENFKEAETVKAKFVSIIVNHVAASAEDMISIAEKRLKEKRYLETIAFFDAAVAFIGRTKNPEEILYTMEICVEGMKKTNKAMVEDGDNMEVIVKDHAILLMRDWLRQMQDTSQVSEEWRCLQVSWALAHIAWSECLIEQLDESEKTLNVAITGMREVFGSDVSEQHGHLFGYLLNILGYVYSRASRFEEAASLYKQSIDARKAATDYVGNEKERDRNIAWSKKHLKNVERKIIYDRSKN